MSAARVEIELDRPPPALVFAGETLAGRVRLSMPEPLRVHGVRLVVGWRTAGRGETDRGSVVDERIVPRQVLEGEHEHAFTVVIPPAPLSHDGRLVKIRWAAEVRVDVVLAPDLRAEAPFRVA